MLDQSLIQSGFDAEILLGESQLKAFLLTLVDAGTIPATVNGLPLLGPLFVDRTYVPDAGSPGLDPVADDRNPFQVEILFDHPTGADVRVHLVILVEDISVDLFVRLAPEFERDEAGMITSARLTIVVVDLESSHLADIENLLQKTKAEILVDVNAKIDGAIDLGGVGTFNRVQEIAIQKMRADGDHQAAYGIYVNLRLQTGPEPESLMAARGDLAAARNFLPAGSDAAMVSRPGLYADAAADAFNRMAEIDENGVVTHPWHKSPFKKTSEVLGKIIDIDVGPMPTPPAPTGGTGVPAGDPPPPALRIDVEVEYEIENFIDPNGHMVAHITPITDSRGTLTWNVNVTFHGSAPLEILGFVALAAIFTGVGAVIGFGLGGAIAFGFIAGSVGDFAGHRIVDEWKGPKKERKIDASIPDVVSGRVEVAQRRWDPFYTTRHQIAMRPDGTIINGQGIALWGRAVIDRTTVPVEFAVIRDKVQPGIQPPTHLRYRVDDAADFKADLEGSAPGTDRRSFLKHDDTHFDLTPDEIVARMKEARIVPDLPYFAKRIDMRQNQVHSILVFSRREYEDVKAGVIAQFEEEKRAEITASESATIRGEIDAEIAASGVTPVPTATEIDEMVLAEIDERVATLVEAFTESEAADHRTDQAITPFLSFDLPPEYFAALEKKQILHLRGLRIVTMRAPGHEGFMYYRDDPDFFVPDNLHELPRYRATPNGPEIL